MKGTVVGEGDSYDAALADATGTVVAAGTALVMTPEVAPLVAAYEARKILPAKFRADMLHIALATVAEVDALVSWNFKHIVRLEKIRLFNEVNTEQGHEALTIPSPREVTTHEDR